MGDKRKVDLQHLDFCNMSAMLLSDRVPERQLFQHSDSDSDTVPNSVPSDMTARRP